MFCFPCAFIIIQDNRAVLIGLSGTIYPHIAFAVCRTSVLCYVTRCFICLYDMIAAEDFMEIIIQNCKISFTALDHPVCHNLFGYVNVISHKFLADTVDWHSVYILCIHNACCQGRGYDTVSQQAFRTVCFQYGLVILSCINLNMMFFYCINSRLYPDSFVDFIRKLFPSGCSECFFQRFIRYRMSDNLHRKIL